MKHNVKKVFLGISLLLPLYTFAMPDSNSDNSQNNQPQITRKNKEYYNLIVHDETVIGELFVDGNELISGNVQVDGNLSVGGTIISSESIDFPVLGTGVVVSNAGALSTSSGTAGQILTSNGPGTVPTFQTGGATSITITGDSGATLTGNSFKFSGGTTGLTFNGTTGPNTETIQGILNVANGGTGDTTFTVNELLASGTTATGAFQQIANGTAGQVLTSTGAGTLPTFQAQAASSITITGDTGGGLTGNSFTFTGGTTGLKFNGAGSTETLGGTLVVLNGGTGQTSFTNLNQIIASGVSTTGAFQQIIAGPAGQVLTSNGSGNLPSYQAISAAGAITTINGNSGSVTPTAGAVTIEGGNNITTSGTGNTLTVNVAGTTTNAVQVGNASGSLTSLPVGTNGQVLLGATGANPAFITPTAGTGLSLTSNATTLQYALTTPVIVSNGGTGSTTFNANGVVISGTTTTSPLTALTLSNGQLVIGSTGASPVAASLTAGPGITITPGAGSITISATGGASGITTIDGNSGSVTGSTVTITGGTSGAVFTGSGATLTESFNYLSLPDSTSSTSGVINIGGTRFMHAYPGISQENTFVGSGAGNFTSVTGQNNTALGFESGVAITSGDENVFIGSQTGNVATTGSGNIYIGFNQNGLANESFTTRIGAGQIALCYIGGISGTMSAGAVPVLINSAGLLGTVSSSRRYKENIASMPDSTPTFMQLNPVVFNYKKQSPADVQYGLIAEEVAELYPDLVVYNSDNEVETVKYHLLYALLIKMIQENRKITDQNSELIKKLCAVCNVQQ